MLSNVIIQENKLRYEFLKENAKKIPNQLFPSLKTLCKNINLLKMWHTLDEKINPDWSNSQLESSLEKLQN